MPKAKHTHTHRAEKRINNSHSITSAIAWNKIRLLSIAVIVASFSLVFCPHTKLTHKQASHPVRLSTMASEWEKSNEKKNK